jgi:hypothetical protein
LMTIFFTIFDPADFGIIKYDQAARLYFSFPLMCFNISVGAYIAHYFLSIDTNRYRVFLIMFFVCLSVMVGSGASLVLEVAVRNTDFLKLVFGDGPATYFVFSVATLAAGWSANQFHKSNIYA